MLFRETVAFYSENHLKDKTHRVGESERFLTLQ